MERIVIVLLALAVSACVAPGKAVIDKNDTPLTLSEKALDYFNNKEYGVAIGYYQAIIDNFKKDQFEKEIAWAYYEIGFCYYTMGDNEKALKYLSIVLNDSSVQAPRVLAEKIKQKISAQMNTGPK
ncbi:MAG: tetratricopeptide repeat protein [Spirochaetota bacterium]